MVIFDTLEIAPNGTDLLVEAHVLDDVKGYNKDVYIKSIVVTTDLNPQKNVMPSFDSANVIFSSTLNISGEEDKYPKKIGLVIPTSAMAFSHPIGWNKVGALKSHVFYVWIETTGIVDECAPCAMHNTKYVGVIINKSELFGKGFGYINELADTCKEPVGFTNFILLYNAFKLAVELNDFNEAERIYGMLMKSRAGTSVSKGGCCCHG